MTVFSTAFRYVGAPSGTGSKLDAESLFEAMVPDLLHDGDVDLAMQKAFRWGFEDGDGEKVPGLKDLTQRLRDERERLEADHAAGESVAGDASLDETPADAAAPDADAFEQQSARIAGQLETLERSLRQIEDIDDLGGLDPELVDSLLTDDERDWVEQWMQMEGSLRDHGYVVEAGERLELTPKAVRRIGERVLREMFTRVTGSASGVHDAQRRARTGTPIETSSPWQYGDPFSINLARTMMNSLRRQGPGSVLRIRPEDFEVHDRESLAASATVLLIDMSRSMFYNGCWDAAKRSALALDTMIRTSYARDDLEIVGFSERAERLTLTRLPSLAWNEYSHGTNLQDGLLLSRNLLRAHRTKTRQIVVITDGEPTAWLEDGEIRFEHPATERVFEATLREVHRCTQEGIIINIVLLDDGSVVKDFAERMARLNGGRLMHADARNLGAFVLRDFMDRRTKRL